MPTLVQVLTEFFRAFGYTPTPDPVVDGASGRRYPVPLLLEKDGRRIAVTLWVHRQPLGAAFVQEFLVAVQDANLDGGLVASLGAIPETLAAQALPRRVQVWDSLRLTQELGSAVVRETCPDAWEQTDPLRSPRPSRILEQVHETALARGQPAVAAPPPPAVDAAAEPPFPAPVTPLMAAPEDAAPAFLELPPAFGLLDQAIQGTPVPARLEPAAAPAPPPMAPTVSAPTQARTPRKILRVQVSKDLAVSLAKPKVRTLEQFFLRLVPHHVFDYEAQLLVEGSLESQKQGGRMAVDAALKRVKPWTHPLDVAGTLPEGTEVDEKPIRMPEPDARRLLTTELQSLVTRDIVQQEDESEWSVIVKKKVELADGELALHYLGLYWAPVWRVSGKDGSVEIDAVTGAVLHEELTVPRSDALLI